MFMLQELANLLLVGKNVLILTAPIVINKDAFVPGYDLKFTVWKLQLLLYQPIHKHNAQRTVSPQQMAASIIIRIKH